MAVQRRLPRTTPSHRRSHRRIWGTYYNPRNAYYNDLGIAYHNHFGLPITITSECLSQCPGISTLATRQEYALRPSVEERHRQLKCFSDLAGFTSRRLSLVVNQVIFVLLIYSLLQWYWQRIRRPEFNSRITARALDQLRPTMTVILIFYQNYVARLAPLEYQELLLTLEEEARLKILSKTRRLRRGLIHQLDHARSP